MPQKRPTARSTVPAAASELSHRALACIPTCRSALPTALSPNIDCVARSSNHDANCIRVRSD